MGSTMPLLIYEIKTEPLTHIRGFYSKQFSSVDKLISKQIAQMGSRIECFTASKGSNNYFYLLLLQLVLCRVAALKSLPVHHP